MMMMSPVMTMNPMTTKHAAEEASAACTGTYQTEEKKQARLLAPIGESDADRNRRAACMQLEQHNRDRER